MSARRRVEKAEEDNGINVELKDALDLLEKEKSIDRATLFGAIESSLLAACKNSFGKNDNIHCSIDRETCVLDLYAEKIVSEEIEDDAVQISIDRARAIDPCAAYGDVVKVPLKSKEFGRIATQSAKNVILQKIREEERNSIYNEFVEKEHQVVTGTVQRIIGRTVNINLGRADALLQESEQIKGEIWKPKDRVKVYVVEVKNASKGPRILVSRTHPELVRKLFENEVAEVGDGTVEIKSIAREAGSRTKMAVWSNNPNVDAVGSCVGMNGMRVNAVVDELGGEKIDIVSWDENPALFIEHALSPAEVVNVIVDPDARTAKVVVPDYQLSLAIGREGQNARLAARLTSFKIDIKSETQAKDAPGFRMEDYLDDEDEDDESYDEFAGEVEVFGDPDTFTEDEDEYAGEAEDADDMEEAEDADESEDVDEAEDVDESEDVDETEDVDEAEEADETDETEDAGKAARAAHTDWRAEDDGAAEDDYTDGSAEEAENPL